jgi:hypothetical protein
VKRRGKRRKGKEEGGGGRRGGGGGGGGRGRRDEEDEEDVVVGVIVTRENREASAQHATLATPVGVEEEAVFRRDSVIAEDSPYSHQVQHRPENTERDRCTTLYGYKNRLEAQI